MTDKLRKRTRRDVLKVAAGLPLALSTGFAAPAIAQSRKKVTLVYAIQTIDSTADGFFAAIPQGLGFYAEEGLEVDIQTVAGSAAAVNLLANGRANFTTHGTAGLFTGVDKGVPMKGFICQIPDYFISIAVDRTGPIQTFDQLKGKTIGVPAASGSPVVVTKSVMKAHGWDPEKDVEFLAVGSSLPALDAMKRGRVKPSSPSTRRSRCSSSTAAISATSVRRPCRRSASPTRPTPFSPRSRRSRPWSRVSVARWRSRSSTWRRRSRKS